MRILALSTILLMSAPAIGADAAGTITPPTITVHGEAEVSVAPDQAIVVLGVEFEAEDATTAQHDVNSAAQAILGALRAQGVADQDVQTSALRLTPVMRRPGVGPHPADTAVAGYRARNTVRIRLGDLARVGPVIDAGLKAGANRLDGVTFELADDQAARTQALRQAVKDAAARAGTIAGALGMHLAGVQDVTEGNVGIRPAFFQESAVRTAAMVATPVSPGEVSVAASVTVRYTLAR
jgi:uncharacterized protein YggE